jgi:hypothetical protein
VLTDASSSQLPRFALEFTPVKKTSMGNPGAILAWIDCMTAGFGSRSTCFAYATVVPMLPLFFGLVLSFRIHQCFHN